MVTPPPGATSELSARRRAAGLGIAVVAIMFILLASVLPLWEARLLAPQYPEGLRLTAYGNRVEGDVDEIGSLNHYVGMRGFDVQDVPEMALWYPSLALAAVAVVVAATRGRRLRWPRRAAVVYLWGMPLGVLADIQLRLYQYGHDLDPEAALRIDPFTPLVIGPTKVYNFTTWSYPGTGLGVLVLAAALVTFGPRLRARWLGAGRVPRATAVAVVVLLGTVGGIGGIAPATAESTVRDVSELRGLIAAAPEGSTVRVPPGVYHGDLVLDRSVVLEGVARPVIEGTRTGTVVTVRASDAVIRGFVIRGSGPGPIGSPAGIRVEADGVEIEDVLIEDTYSGIVVDEASVTRILRTQIRGRASAVVGDDGHAVGEHGPHHAQSTALERGDGVAALSAEGLLIRDSSMQGVRDGIYLSFSAGALIDRNQVQDARYAIHSMYSRDLVASENHFMGNRSGIVLMYGGPALLLRNTMHRNRSSSTGFGVLLKDVEDVQLVESVMVGNRVALHVDGPPGAGEPATIQRNTIASNDIGAQIYPSARAAFSANSFVENRLQVLLQGTVPDDRVWWWDEGAGNYWSSYTGYDHDGDGIGDVPHREGGSLHRAVSASPELAALSGSPAMGLLTALERKWVAWQPAALDRLPLMAPHSPALAAHTHAGGLEWGAMLGGVVLAVGGALLTISSTGRRNDGSRWKS